MTLLSALLMLLCLCNIGLAGTVIIKPGKFDHFSLQMPDKAVAGENFVITVSAYDANNNLITNFSETGKEFRVDVSGTATVQPAVINSSSFAGGLANIVINSKKAEKLNFSIKETGGTVPVVSRDLAVVPNKPDHFVVQSPSAVSAGASFDIKIAARDAYDNPVTALDMAKSIKVTATGTSTLKILGSDSFDFKNGIASAAFVAEKAGDVSIEFVDVTSGIKGKSGNIQVAHAALAYFRLQAPKTAIAGEFIDLVIAAYDAFGNIVTGYSTSNSGVILSVNGSSKIEPSTVNASEFRYGQANIRVTYDKAETIEIVAKEMNKDQSGRTSEIAVTNSAADHFIVVTPDAAVSGQRFRIRVEAYDRFNNPAKNFNVAGGDVILTSTGSGTLSPAKIAASEFAGGIAVVDVIYDRAESFQITAGLLSGARTYGRSSVSESNVKRDVARAAATKKTSKKPAVQTDAPASKKTEPEKPRRDKIEKTPKQEPKKDIQKPQVKGPSQDIKLDQKPHTAVAETKPAQTKHTGSTIAAPAVTAEKAVSESPKKADEPSKKDEKKSDKTLYNVSKISIIESKNKAMLVVNITSPNGNLIYSDEIESKHGKEWLKLKIKPAVSSTEKTFKFKSAYIGDVLIEEDKSGAQSQVIVYIELVPSGVTYDIARVKNTLVVTLSNP